MRSSLINRFIPFCSLFRCVPIEERHPHHRAEDREPPAPLHAAMPVRIGGERGGVRGQMVPGPARILPLHAQRTAQHENVPLRRHNGGCKWSFNEIALFSLTENNVYSGEQLEQHPSRLEGHRIQPVWKL